MKPRRLSLDDLRQALRERAGISDGFRALAAGNGQSVHRLLARFG